MQLAVDVIVVALEEDPKVLLIKRANDPFKGSYALPGGLVDDDEEIEDAAIRELNEETGLEVTTLMSMQAYGDIDRDPRGRIVSIPHLAVIPSALDLEAGDDAAKAEWVSIDKVPELAFDHNEMLHEAMHLISNHAHYVSDMSDDDSVKEILSKLSHSC